MVMIHPLRGFSSALIRLSYIGGVWRKAWGSNPYDVAVITVFKTDKRASLAAFLESGARRPRTFVSQHSIRVWSPCFDGKHH